MKPLLLLLLTLASARGLNLSFLAWDEAIAGRELAVVKGTTPLPITHLHPLRRTDSIAATPAETGLVLRALDRTTADGKPLDFTVKLDSGMVRPLILLLPDPQSPGGVRGYAVEDNPAAFAWGSFRVLNTTGQPLAIALGQDRKMIPEGWTPVDFKTGGTASIPIWVGLSTDLKTPLYTSVWKTNPDVRRLVIVLPSTDPRLGKIALKVIPETKGSEPVP